MTDGRGRAAGKDSLDDVAESHVERVESDVPMTTLQGSKGEQVKKALAKVEEKKRKRASRRFQVPGDAFSSVNGIGVKVYHVDGEGYTR